MADIRGRNFLLFPPTIFIELKINVVSDKLNESEFISLVNYVESKSVGLWSKYSLLKNSALLNEEMDKNDWQIIFFQEFIKKLKEKYLYQFQYDKLKFLKGESEIIPYSSDVLVDEDSTIWLTQNLDILAYTHSNRHSRPLSHRSSCRFAVTI